jgi:hypothetical protein
MQDIIRQAKEYALKEIALYHTPKIEHFDLANQIGQELAVKLGVDKDVVMLGTILMDLKLGECLKENKVSEHIQRSSEMAGKFLDQFNLPEEVYKKVINCVEAHHGTKSYNCIEAEICANADCYKFLHPRGILGYLVLLGTRGQNIDDCFTQLLVKMEEKYKIISLDICKEELNKYYVQFKELIDKAKKI